MTKKDGYTWEDLDRSFWEGFDNAKNKMKKRIEELEKENAELKGKVDSMLDNWCKGDDPCPHLKKRDEQLTKAKEIIKKLMEFAEMDDREYEEEYKEAEQFLNSEVEK